MNEKIESIKKTIAFFLEIESNKIEVNSVIDNSVLQGSVKIHMMYGELADNGFKVDNYNNIHTFGELLQLLKLNDGVATTNSVIEDTSKTSLLTAEKAGSTINAATFTSNIGVDILSVSKLPQVNDFRESSFYTDNFSLKEIAYCITKNNPYKCFAGKFAAKEAVVKADNSYKNEKFSAIEVLNNAHGMPYFKNVAISIAHEDEMVVAIASANTVANGNKQLKVENTEPTNPLPQKAINGAVKEELKSNSTNLKGVFLFTMLINVLLVTYIIFEKYFS